MKHNTRVFIAISILGLLIPWIIFSIIMLFSYIILFFKYLFFFVDKI